MIEYEILYTVSIWPCVVGGNNYRGPARIDVLREDGARSVYPTVKQEMAIEEKRGSLSYVVIQDQSVCSAEDAL